MVTEFPDGDGRRGHAVRSFAHDLDVDGGDGGQVAGLVVNETGVPVANATVTIVPTVEPRLVDAPATLEARAAAPDARANNMSPPKAFEPDRTLRGRNGHFADHTQHGYVASHAASDWSAPGLLGGRTATLSDPRVTFSDGQTVALSVWSGTDGLIQDGVDGDLPGRVDDDRRIVIAELGPDGGTIRRWTTGTEQQFGVTLGGSHEYAHAYLGPGYYRIHPVDTPEAAYAIRVGHIEEIFDERIATVEEQSDALEAKAVFIRTKTNEIGSHRRRVSTNATGHWNASLPRSVGRVSVSVGSGMRGEFQHGPRNATVADRHRRDRETESNGTPANRRFRGDTDDVAGSAARTTVDLPATNVTIRVSPATGASGHDRLAANERRASPHP